MILSLFRKIYGYLLSCGLLCLYSADLSALEIVRDGKAESVIITAENPPVQMKKAAESLQKILFRMSGVLLPIVTENNVPAGRGKISIGENKFTKKHPYRLPAFTTSAYDIYVKDDLLILNGPLFRKYSQKDMASLSEKELFQLVAPLPEKNDPDFYSDYGPMHAVSAFLEYLGVRFYAPGSQGIFVPEKKTIILQNMRISRQAAFAVRKYMLPPGMEKDPETEEYFRFLKSGSSLPVTGVLALSRVLKQGEKNQESFFALDGEGKRYKAADGGGIPRYSDPSFRKKCLEELEKIFRANPFMEEILILPPVASDDYVHYRDEIKYLKKTYPVTYRQDIPAAFYMYLAENIARSFPGKKILFRSQGHILPAKSFQEKYPGNLLMIPDVTGAVSYAFPAFRNSFLAGIEKYHRQNKGQKILLREYWNEYNDKSIPRQGFYFMQALQEVRKKQQKSVKGFFMDLPYDGEKNALADKEQMHYPLYVNSRLLWEPGLDLASLQKEYCRNFYGPAAKDMEEFLLLMDKLNTGSGSRNLSPANTLLNRNNAAKIIEILAGAEKKTRAGSIYRKRVTELEKSFRFLKKDHFEQWKKIDLNKEKLITGEILPEDSPCNGDLSKFKKWYPLSSPVANDKKTFVAVAVRENRYKLQFAFRCYENQMDKIKTKGREYDSCRIEQDEHILIEFYTEHTGSFTMLVNSSGVILDKSSDPDTLRTVGDGLFWDHFRNRAVVRKYSDCWEADITMVRRGRSPEKGVAAPWKLRMERISFLSGKKVVQSLAGGENKYCRLEFPKTDSKGRDYIPRYNTVNVPVPGVVSLEQYKIKRAKGKVKFSPAEWENGCWKDIQELCLGNNLFTLGKSSSFVPDARSKMQYDDSFLYVFYKVKDKYVRGFFRKDQQNVCADSCMELFLRPGGTKGRYYFNFEMNCVGSLLLAQVQIPEKGGRKKFNMIPENELKRIKRYTTLKNVDGEIEEDTLWYAALQIPWDLLEKYSGIPRPRKGDVWSCNFYKCAEWSSKVHYITWKKTETFHAPEYFGRLVFE